MLKKHGTAFKVFYSFAVLFFVLFTMGPILWSFLMSITPQVEILSNTTRFWPKEPTLDNYTKLIFDTEQQGRLFRDGIFNSIKAAGLSLLIGMPIAVLCAYALSRIKFKASTFLKNILLFTMAIPVFATIIPLYKMFATFQLLDNLFALVLVYVTSFLPLTVWLLMTFFETLPKELEEAAYIDGCSRLKTLMHIILPISYPVVFAATLIVFLATWNQFQIPLILAPAQSTKPIAVVISEFVTKSAVDYGLMNAGGILAIIPPAVVAIVFRKFLIKGIVGETRVEL